MTLAPGARLGPYEVIAPLGSGGMGQVYLARDARLARDVALKVLLAEVTNDPARLKRFENEARSASALNHPNIVTIYDVGTSDSVSWIAMERVEGKTLRELLPAGALPVKRLLAIAVQIADGLATAHEAGIVHRDLKPENVMLTKDERVKILDFGLAKLAPMGSAGAGRAAVAGGDRDVPGSRSRDGRVHVARAGAGCGSRLPVGPVFARVGALRDGDGKRAFQGKSAVDTMAAIINQEPEPIEKLDPRVPGPAALDRRAVPGEGAGSPLRIDAGPGARSEVRPRSSVGRCPASSAISPRAPRSAFRVCSPAAAGARRSVGIAGLRLEARRQTGRFPTSSASRLAAGGVVVRPVRARRPDDRVRRLLERGTDPRSSRRGRTGASRHRLELPDADVVSVSSLGEMALSLGRVYDGSRDWVGTLARVPLTGGAPREMIRRSRGRRLVVRTERAWPSSEAASKESTALEYPIGKVLYETEDWIAECPVRIVAGRGSHRLLGLARSEAKVTVETVDLDGKHRVLSGPLEARRRAWPGRRTAGKSG